MADTPKLRWLPCKNCGRAWLSKTEPYILGSGASAFPMRYRCYRCRGNGKGASGSGLGGVQSISGAQWAGLPAVPWSEIERFFPGWIESHFFEEAAWNAPRTTATNVPPLSTPEIPMDSSTESLNVDASTPSTGPEKALIGLSPAESTSESTSSTPQ